MAQSQSHQDYTIGWICVLEPEYIAARAMLDHTNQEKLPAVEGDSNNYTFGRIGKHNVVIASLPSGTYGTNPAAVVATQMARSFPDLRFILLVGIGGGVPQMSSDPDEDIYLGDVIVSNPTEKSGGVIQYDLGKMHEGAPRPTRIGTLDKPPELVRTAVACLKASHGLKSFPLEEHLLKMAERHPFLVPRYQYQGTANDVLFDAGYRHEGNSSTCDNCLPSKVVQRPPRETTQPRIHYGTIASGNQVVKDSVTREFWRKEAEVLCFEMEAAGLMDSSPCLVIRGICDYADSHKNERWQKYAAATAAAYAKDLLLETAPKVVRAAETPLRGNQHWMVPRNVNRHFTGRSEILERLRLAFFSESQVQKTFVIAGDGGIGKSEVCLNFVHKYRQKFWGIFWIDTSSRSSAQQAFLDVAKLCGINLETPEQVRTWLSNAPYSWLLVIDNADNPTIDYAEVLPTGIKGNILFTTRNPQCIDQYATVGSESLDYLGIEDAEQLLFKTTGIAATLWEDRDEAAKRIIRTLGSHTLAIIQAGAYIKQRFCSLEDYPTRFKQQQDQLLKFHPQQAQSAYKSVYATFEVSVTSMESSGIQAATNALQLLGILAFFHFEEISESIFRRAWDETVLIDKKKFLSEVDLSRLPWVKRQHKDISVDHFAWQQSLNILESYSLIKINNSTESSWFSMHPLIHAWSKLRLDHESRKNGCKAAGCIIALSMGGLKYQIFFEKLRSHVRAYLDHPVIEYMERIPTAELYQTFIYICWLLEKLEEDSRFATLVQILDEVKSRRGATERVSLDIQYLMAICHGLNGQHHRAVPLLEHLVERQKGWMKPENSELLGSQYDLAKAYCRNGQAKRAAELLEYVIEIQQRSLKPDNENVLMFQHELAVAYQTTGRVEKALEMLEHIVGIEERLLEPQNPFLLSSQHELARAYQSTGRIKKAIEILEHVVGTRERWLEPRHRSLLVSQHELARAYHEDGQVKRAIELLENVVRIKATTLKPEDRDRLVSEHELARAYHEDGQVNRAIELLENVVNIDATTLKPEDRDRSASEHELARALMRNEEAARAAELLEKVIEIQERVLEARDPDLMGSRDLLADVYTSMKVEEEGDFSDSLHPPPSSAPSKSDNEASVPSHGLRTTRARTQRGKLLDKGIDIEESEHEGSRSGEPTATRGSSRSEGSDGGEISVARRRKGGQKRQASTDLTGVASKRGRRH